ncbi:hypothetical protein GCM10025870_27880 [Agromyces marinus]|uniref:Uncharacterized protein n=1 Tax=Agromyces marinus TaxID=1389020 RepID=A0ABN6YIC5_9MICO|nr:hypothetical protein [Agromyces marinus]BDZ55715.1 hypothetical protein GCM10025870_27880 [Agromyces marinus]
MLVLAARLRSIPRERLAAALATRELDHAGVDDLFDLAEALTAPDSIDHAVGRLERPALAVLAAAAESADDAGWVQLDVLQGELRRLGADGLADDSRSNVERLEACLLALCDGDRVHVPLEVATRLHARIGDDLPELEALAAPAPPLALAGERADHGLLERRAAETAYATVAATAELLAGLAVQPARELAKGGFALPDAKRLAEATGVDLDDFPRLVRRAVECGLIVRDGPVWLESDDGADWIMLGTADRWTRLADAWRERIPAPLRDLVIRRSEALTASSIRDDVAWYYPGGGTWLTDGMTRLLEDAEALGLAVAGEPSRRPRSCSAAICPPRRNGCPATSRRRSTRSTSSTTSRSSPRPARALARREAPHVRRRRGARPRVELPGDRGIRQPRTRRRRGRRRHPLVPRGRLADRHPAAARLPADRVGGALRRGPRRRSGCHGRARADLRPLG